MARYLLRIPTELKEELRQRSKKLGITLNGFILQILWDWVNKAG